ncbi:hypothetical protein [Tessaracoccus flavus]|uniref:Uncharacterized protein n=1 Tax=Tessaracoccus flavus TaxID=1610493 RepID=A0A1Q2CFC6_9ACTN|nr:hypothetical protein [Tessaracoccus flavus]AQP44811.1 hypothetical protein RPIT_08395 [Tessaracoccus flavus]SDZ22178.1 hypothetical protein SAMN05428934_1203 [Tessaracoccus flavus]
MTKLTDELVGHLQALGDTEMPNDVLSSLDALAEIDEKGTGSCYAGLLSARSSANLDITALTKTLEHTSLMLTVTIDAVTNGQGA